jgi:hypothetical protein
MSILDIDYQFRSAPSFLAVRPRFGHWPKLRILGTSAWIDRKWMTSRRECARIPRVGHDSARPDRGSDSKQRSTGDRDFLRLGVIRITDSLPHFRRINDRIGDYGSGHLGEPERFGEPLGQRLPGFRVSVVWKALDGTG